MPSVGLLRRAQATVQRLGTGDGASVFAHWYNSQGDICDTRTFEGVWAESGRVAHELRVVRGLDKGDRAVLCYNFGLDFFVAFLGCLRAGVLAVPVYPPSPLTLKKSLVKLQAIVDACQPRAVLLSSDVNRLRLATRLNPLSKAVWPDLPYVPHGVSRSSSEGGRWFGRGSGASLKSYDDESLQENDIAFLQFTSGSTSEPKGVMVTFGNLAHNVLFMSTRIGGSFRRRGIAENERPRGCSWMPQYHDLGLIQCTIMPFLSGWQMGFMSPLDFVRQPLSWLRLLAVERAHFSCVPDFALRLCVRKWNELTPEARASMAKATDLSAIRWIQNAAEPVRSSSFREFGDTFAELGLPATYTASAYGLAEHVVAVVAHEPGLSESPPRPFFERSDAELECVGNVLADLAEGCELKIVDPVSRREVPTGETGELWLSSPSVAAGYWGKPELTEETFRARIEAGAEACGREFLRTGDLAAVDDLGRCFIRGRMKDLIIVRGRNIYPQDVEFAVQEASSMVRPGCVAAFSTTELGGELEIVAEVRKSAEKNQDALEVELEAVRRAVAAEGCSPSRLVAIEERSIPKTTSGKIQRRRTRDALHEGSLRVVAELTATDDSREAPYKTPQESGVDRETLADAASEGGGLKAAPSEEQTTARCAGSSGGRGQEQGAVGTGDGFAVIFARESDDDAGDDNDNKTKETIGFRRDSRGGVVDDEEEEQGPPPRQQQRQRQQDEAGDDRDGLLNRQKRERLCVLTDLVVDTAMHVLRGARLTPDEALFDAGFDSVSAEEFVGRLQERLAEGGWVHGDKAKDVLTSTTVFDCPTARNIAEHIEGVLARGGIVEAGTGDDAAAAAGHPPSGSAKDSGSSAGMEPFAVVGIACRFPGGCDSPEAFWDFLRKGSDAIGRVPTDRWSRWRKEKSFADMGDGAAGPSAGSGELEGGIRGGFLKEAEAWSFDNSFFWIPPAEARAMDPQQRLMLEIGYEALHRAGFTRESLRGSDTGVFVGACGADWASMLAEVQGPEHGPYTSTGAASAMLANRLSYTLGMTGPSVTVDTACSSSLVALRQACLHLAQARVWRGRGENGVARSPVALVGGVNLLLSPGPFDLFAKTGMLAPDGRSKAFSAHADGYGRGEGCGAVVLKRLVDARADGDRVYAVIKGSAVGHNGKSATMTAPNGASQRATIAQALQEANVLPREVSYVEAHGTGTALGDPVEFGALKSVYGAGRSPDDHLVIGALKTNIGHLEGAAGIAGLIKAVLVLAHGAAPPNLHASEVNPRLDLSSLPAVLPAPGALTRLRAAAAEPGENAEPGRDIQAKHGDREDDEDAVGRAIGDVVGDTDNSERGDGRKNLGASGYPSAAAAAEPETCASVRDCWESGDSDMHPRSPILFAGVSSFGFGGTNAHVVLAGEPRASSGDDGGGRKGSLEPTPGVAFLFTGQGSQYPGMGRHLYETDGRFREVMDVCDRELEGVLPRSLLEVLYGNDVASAALLDTTRYAQPALFAVECATAAALRAAGITPSAVLGHSLGELAAACVAGVMSLSEGVRFVAERGRLMEEASAIDGAGGGEGEDHDYGPECMAAVRSEQDCLTEALALYGAGRVSLAAVNGPESAVLSGPRHLVEAVAAAALSHPPVIPHRNDNGHSEDGQQASRGSCNATVEAVASEGQGGDRRVEPRAWPAVNVSSSSEEEHPCNAVSAAVLDGSDSGSVSPSTDSEGGQATSESGISSEGLPCGDARNEAQQGLCSLVGSSSSSSVYDGEGSKQTSAAARTSDRGSATNNGSAAHRNGGDRETLNNGSCQPTKNATASTNGTPVSDLESPTLRPTASTAGSPELPPERFRILKGVSRAFHSPSMASAARGVEVAARKMSLHEPIIPLASNVTGGIAEEGLLTDPAYWARHVLGTVRFHDGLEALTTGLVPANDGGISGSGGGISTFVEVGPSSLLSKMGKRELSASAVAGAAAAEVKGVKGRESDHAGSDTVRWLPVVSPEEGRSGQSGLGHVIGALKGVHYRRRLFPLHEAPRARVCAPTIPRHHPVDTCRHHRRPPLHLLEIRWLCLGDAIPAETGSSCLPSNGGIRSEEAPTPLLTRGQENASEAPMCPSHGPGDSSESVWLLSGRTSNSYSELCDALSGADCLAHFVALGPSAPGGEKAAIGRLERSVLSAASEQQESFLVFAEAFARAGRSSPRPLPEAVVVTRGVHPCTEGDKAEGWSMSWLPGLLRSLALENPHVKLRHVDLPVKGAGSSVVSPMQELVGLMSTSEGKSSIADWEQEPESCLRGGKLFVPRLRKGGVVDVVTAGRQCPLAKRVSSEASYVITGGTGGIGLELALRFARAGAGGLVLLSRGGKGFAAGLEAGSRRSRAWETLSGMCNTKVLVLRCDVTAGDDVMSAIAEVSSSKSGLPAVRGIVHAACPAPPHQAAEAAVKGAEGADVDQAFLQAKVAGALNLSDSAVRLGLDLDFLVLLSSASAILGLSGQAGYAAANGCLDGLAWHLRRTRGLKAISVQYGPWIEAGTALDRDGAVEALNAVGHLGVTNDEGFSALGHLLGCPSSSSPGAAPPVAAVMPMNWERYFSVFSDVPPLLSVVGRGGRGQGATGDARNIVPVSREGMVELLLETARQVTGWAGELGEEDDVQEQVGMDSLQAVEFRRLLCLQLGRPSIPTTLAYDCPTAGRMADELLRTAGASPAPRVSLPPAAAAAAAAAAPARQVSRNRAGVVEVGAQTNDDGEGCSRWQEERHLDNPLYLLYKFARALAAYLYIACVVMAPGRLFIQVVRQILSAFLAPQMAQGRGAVLAVFAALPVAWMAYGLHLCLLVAASKWLLVGRIQPGASFTTHSLEHLAWWTTQRLQSFAGLLFVDELRRSRLIVWYYRLLGARLGRDVFLNTVRISDPDLVSVGDGSTINEHADLGGHKIVGNRVVFGSGVSVGANSVLLPSAYLAPEAHIADKRVVGSLDTEMHPTRRNSTPPRSPTPPRGVCLQVVADFVSLYATAVTVGAAAFLGFQSFSWMLEAGNIFPGAQMSALGYGPLAGSSSLAFACYTAVFLLNRLYLPVLLIFAGVNSAVSSMFLTETVLKEAGLGRALLAASASAVVFHVSHMMLSVMLKWVLVQRISPVDGVCHTLSWFGVRKQITDRLIMSAMMRSVLMFNGNLGNSLWLRALGGPVGHRVSVMLNKNIYTEAELLALGDDMHVGFASSTYCTLYTAPDAFTLRKTAVGHRGLNGAGSVMLPGATLPEGGALGPNTRLAASDPVRGGALHLGSPVPMVAGRYKSPARELSRQEMVLYYAAPVPLAMLSTAVTLSAAFWPLLGVSKAAAVAGGGPGTACLLAPLAWLGLGASLAATGAIAKWSVLGKQHPSYTKLWSFYHYRTLLVLYIQVHAHFLFVDVLRRGVLFNCYARLLGASVGRDADVATMYFTDHDLISIGDRAVVQEDCIPHPQFFFEGNMSFAPVSIGAGSTAGARSVLLGGGEIKPGGALENLGIAAMARATRDASREDDGAGSKE